MALILNLETATPVCSVAISRDGVLLGLRESTEDKSHATRLTLFIQELLGECRLQAGDLEAVSVSMGPGSYTGLRIGASVAKGFAYGAGIPVIGIPTLQALSRGLLERILSARTPDILPTAPLLCPMLDARRLEVYTAIYDTSLNELQPVEALILEPQSFSSLLDRHVLLLFGSGSKKAAEILRHPNVRWIPDVEASAADQSRLAEDAYARRQFLDTAYFEPHYLKEFIASIPKNKVFGSPVK